MSQTIDTKVVEMKFDNSNFESNVKQSQSTLEKLKKDLDMTGSADSFKNISNAVKDVSFDGMTKGLEEAKGHFSVFEEIAVGALRKIGESAIETGLSMAKSLSVDLVSAGWGQFEEKTKSVQTIMNATGEDIDTVSAALDKLMWFTDETSYSFSDMTNNIGKFTSMGVDLETSTSAMMGISNWAAVSGAGINEASRAMYNLSQAMGVGAVKLQDWKSIENANMATAEFKQQVIDTAREMGVLDEKSDVTLQNFSSTLKSGWFTSDVLLKVLKDYASFSDQVYERVQETGEACSEAMEYVREYGDSFSEVAEKAFRAAQEAKTFTDAVEAVKDAVKTQWSTLFEGIFGNYEEAKVTWTNLANSLWEVFASPLSDINEAIQEAIDPKDVDLSMWNNLRDEIKTNLGYSNEEMELFEKTLSNTAKQNGIDVDSMIEKWGSFASSINNGHWLNSDIIKETVDSIKDGSAFIVDTLNDYVLPSLENVLGFDLSKYTFVDENTEKSIVENLDTFFSTVKRMVEDAETYGIDNVEDPLRMLIDEWGFSAEDATALINNLSEATKSYNDIISASGTEFSAAGEKLSDLGDIVHRVIEGEFGNGEERVRALTEAGWDYNEVQEAVDKTLRGEEITFNDLSDATLKSLGYTEDQIARLRALADMADEAGTSLNEIYSYVDGATLRNNIWDNLFNADTGAIVTYFDTIKETFNKVFGSLESGAIYDFLVKMEEKTSHLLDEDRVARFQTRLEGIFRVIHTIFTAVKGVLDIVKTIAGNTVVPVIKGLLDIILAIADGIGGLITQFDEGGKLAEFFSNAVDGIDKALSPIKRTIEVVLGTFANFINALFRGQSFATAFKEAMYSVFVALDPNSGRVKFQKFSAFVDKVKDLGSQIGDTFRNIGDKIKEAWEIFQNTELGQSISDLVQKIKDALSGAFESVKDWFKNLFDFTDKDTDFSFFEKFETAFTNFNAWLSNLDLNNSINKVSDSVVKFKDKVKSAFDSVVDYFKNNKTIQTSLDFVKDKFKDLKDTITSGSENGVAEEKEPFVTRVLNNLKIALEWFVDNLPSIINSIKGLLGAGALGSLISLILKIRNMFSGGTGILKNINKVLSGIGNALNAFAFEKLGKGVLYFAFAIDAIALALIGLTLVDADKLANVGLVLAGVAAGFGLLAIGISDLMGALGQKRKGEAEAGLLNAKSGLLNGLSSGLNGLTTSISGFISSIGDSLATSIKITAYAKFIVALAAAIGVLAIAVYGLAQLDLDKLISGLGSVLMLIGAVTAAMKVMSSGDGKIMGLSSGLGLIGMATSILILVKAIDQICQYNLEELAKGMTTVGVLLAELGIATRLASKNYGMSNGLALVGVAASMLIFVKSIDKIRQFNLEEILKGVTGLGLVLLEVAAFTRLSGSTSFSQGVGLAAMAASILIFVQAVKQLSEIRSDQLGSGLGGLLVILMSLAGFIWVLDKIASGTENITKLLFSMAAVIAAVSAAVWVLADAINKGIDLDQIGIQLGKLVSGLVEGLVDALVNSADAIIEGILSLLSSLSNYAPRMVDILVDLVTNVLDSLTTRLPELATSIANFCGALIDSFAEAFKGVDVSSLVTVLNEILFATASLVVIGHFGSFSAVTKGIGMLAEVIGAFGLIIAAFGALNLIPGFNEFMAGGAQVLTTIADGIGSFFGALIGGFVGTAIETFSSSLPEIANNLSAFITNLQPFLDGCTRIDSSVLDSINNLTLAMLAITGASFVDTVLNGIGKLFGYDAKKDFISSFVDLGEGLAQFADTIKGVDFSAVKGAANAAQVLTQLVSIVPNENSIFGWITGTKDFAKAEVSFGQLGRGVADFCSALNGVTIDAGVATSAAGAISALMDVVPNENGLWPAITGTKDLGKFSTNLGDLGRGVADFCTAVGDSSIDSATVTSAAGAISALMDVIPNEEGLWPLITGTKDLGKFSTNLNDLGKGVADFCTAVGDSSIDSATVTSAAGAISALMDVIPNDKGLWPLITGTKDLGKFGDNLGVLGKGVSDYVTNTQSITQEAVDSGKIAAEGMIAIMNLPWPTTGGLAVWIEKGIGGFTDFNLLSTKFSEIGAMAKTLVSSFDGIQIETATNAKTAAQAIIDILNMPWPKENSGIIGWIQSINGVEQTGSGINWKVIADTMGSLVGVAKTMSEEMAGVKLSGIQMGKQAIEKIVEILTIVPDSSTLPDTSLFKQSTDDTVRAAGYFANYATTIEYTAVQLAVTSIRLLIALLETMSTTDFTGAAGFSTALETLATDGITKFTSAFTDSVDTVKTTVETFISDVVEVLDVPSDFEDAGDNDGLSFNDGLSDWGDDVKTTSDSIINNSITALTQLDKFKTAGYTDGGGFNEGLNHWLTPITTVANTIISNSVSALTQMDSFRTAGYTDGGGFYDGFTYWDSSITTAVSNLISAMYSYADQYNLFYSAGLSDGGGLYNGFYSFYGYITSAASTIVSTAASYANNYNGFYSSGQYCGEGLYDGLYSYADYIYEAARRIAANAKAEADSALQVKSPSRKMYETGMYFDLGLANGIIDYGEEVTGAAFGVAENSARVVKETLSGINFDAVDESPMFNPAVMDFSNVTDSAKDSAEVVKTILTGINFDDLDDAPTIRPVMDLSNVQNGVNLINDMLYKYSGKTLDATANIKLADSISKLKDITADDINKAYDDTDMLSMIGELRDKFDNMSDNLKNMKVYLNGKDLVGGIASDMDKALGVYSTKKIKGVM